MSGSAQGGGRERRRHSRLRIAVRARLEAPPRAAQPCEVHNMSVGSAMIATAQPLRLGQSVVLHVETFGPICGHVARVTSTAVAIAFVGFNAQALGDFIAGNSVAAPASDHDHDHANPAA